jgi:microcystin degradation protein MlrC
MKLRIGIGGIFHETNTYAAALTELRSFIVLRETEIFDYAAGTRTYLGGLIDGTTELDMEPVPLLYAEATPSGTLAANAYTGLRDELIDRISSSALDGVLLSLHGAGVAEGADNIEEDICDAIRRACGSKIPIVATLDHHGNLNQPLGDLCSALFPVRFNPHTDQHERGVEAAAAISRILRESAEFETAVEVLPMMFAAVPTSEPVFQELDALCQEIEARDDVLCARVMHGFPFADVPRIGSAVCVVTDKGAGARDYAKKIASTMWANREKIKINGLPPGEAIQEALDDGRRQIVINEFADNTGGGAPGDGTHLLRALIDADAHACFSHVNDPGVVRQAAAAGVGATVHVELGGHSGELNGTPIATLATVLGINNGLYRVKSPMGTGEIIDLGLLATLQIGNVVVIVSTGRRQTLDDGPFIKAGIDVAAFPIIAIKSSAHFRAYFRDHCDRIITADTPGLTPLNVGHLMHKRLNRKTWPIDADASYDNS